MSTLQTTNHVPARASNRITAVVVTIGALIAIVTLVLILALTGASTGNRAPAVTQSGATAAQAPFTSYGAGHAVLDPATGQMHGG